MLIVKRLSGSASQISQQPRRAGPSGDQAAHPTHAGVQDFSLRPDSSWRHRSHAYDRQRTDEVRSRNPSIRRRSILRTDNVSSTSHIDHLSSASLTATKPFIAITWGCHERRDHVAVPIAEDHDLVALELLVAAEAEVVPAFLGRCGRASARDDGL